MSKVTREMIAAAHDVTMRHKIVLGHELLTEIYQAMDAKRGLSEAAKNAQSIIDSLRKQADLEADALDRKWALEMIAAIREALAEQPAQQDMPKIGCVNHDCDKCKAQQQEPVRVPVTDNTYNYAKSLAEAIFKQHFASDEHYSSGRIVWGVNDTVIGILTQIDNMVADMVRRPAQRKPLTDDPLQGAVDWLLEADGEYFCTATVQRTLRIGYNRAKRLCDTAKERAAHGIKGDA